MDRRFFLRSLFAVAGAAALVPVIGPEDEAMAAPRAKADVTPAPAETPGADAPGEGATESQYYYYRRPPRFRYYRRPRFYYRPRYVYRRPRFYYRRPRRFYRRRFW